MLKNFPGVLHVRIIAPLEIQIQRMEERGVGDKRKALQVVQRGDRDSAGYVRGFFGVDWDDPALYDPMVNTRHLSAEEAGRVIMESARSLDIREGGGGTPSHPRKRPPAD